VRASFSFVTGSPSGPTIISETLLTVINWMRLGMEAQAAINAPRFHRQWLPDQILMEESFPENMEQALQRAASETPRAHRLGECDRDRSQTGERLGAADPRDNGAAVGH
jgi:gamma-glutamyltranspeptidase/glutathione hydrolase